MVSEMLVILFSDLNCFESRIGLFCSSIKFGNRSDEFLTVEHQKTYM